MPESFSIDSQPYFFLKKRFIIIFWCVYMCICVWACACVLRGQMSWINRNGIYSQFEPCDVGSGNRTQVLWKSSIFAFSHWAVSPAPLPYLFLLFHDRSFTEPGAPSKTGWLWISRIWLSTPYPQPWGLRYEWPRLAFMWIVEIWTLKSSCLHRKHFAHWLISLNPPFLFYI